MKCYLTYEYRIETAEYQQLLRLPYEICRKYCLMVKNHSLPEYSSLVCNIMNYVSAHISEDLNLSAIADYFHKNPAYISGTVPQGTTQSLTDFIQKERIQSAIQYFNTTNMSVAEVAGNVGFQDFAYFSRISKSISAAIRISIKDGKPVGLRVLRCSFDKFPENCKTVFITFIGKFRVPLHRPHEVGVRLVNRLCQTVLGICHWR